MSPRLAGPLLCAAAVVAVTFAVADPDEPPSAPPTAASAPARDPVQEFCSSHKALQLAFSNFATNPTADTLAHLKKVAAEVQAAAPDDMPEDAARGLSFVVTALTALSDDAGPEDLGQIDAAATRQDTVDATALGDYVSAHCQPDAPAA